MVLAVSGGADSVALLRAMIALKAVAVAVAGSIFVAHLNHGLRGHEADADAEWLAALCERLKIPLKVSRSGCDVTRGASKATAGRRLPGTRVMTFCGQAAERALAARFVATAHTLDDQVETVLQRIAARHGFGRSRGHTGARPLSGSVSLVRPLLMLIGEAIEDYLAAVGQDYRTDATNADSRLRRNRCAA